MHRNPISLKLLKGSVNIETIVKGKIVELNYSDLNYIIDSYYFNGIIWSNKIELYKERVNDYRQYSNKYTPMVLSDILEWQEIFSSKDIEFRLTVGERFNLNGESLVIEKIDGTNDNQIVYYVDKIADVKDNREKYSEVLQQVKDDINKKIDDLNREIFELKTKEETEVKNEKKWFGLF